jgi:hypothetical protein
MAAGEGIMHTIIGRFECQSDARRAIRWLRRYGFPRDALCISSDARVLEEHAAMAATATIRLHAQAGRGGGSVLGTILALVLGLTMVPLPVAHTLAPLLVIAVCGGVLGAVVGGMLGRRDGQALTHRLQPTPVLVGRPGLIVSVQAAAARTSDVVAMLENARALEVLTIERS